MLLPSPNPPPPMPAPQYTRRVPELLPAVAVMLPPVMVMLLLLLELAPPMPAPPAPPVAVSEPAPLPLSVSAFFCSSVFSVPSSFLSSLMMRVPLPVLSFFSRPACPVPPVRVLSPSSSSVTLPSVWMAALPVSLASMFTLSSVTLAVQSSSALMVTVFLEAVSLSWFVMTVSPASF